MKYDCEIKYKKNTFCYRATEKGTRERERERVCVGV